ncbi:unnamed protein product [Linum trigynum]|uniref:Reverse transcriptase zinc-binding domain-containing protein n=1 Tax=Linum trigynum TaxID=586398 RepID=A0AAV2D045_9ROSI
MDSFYKLSGLRCNPAKCQLFCAGIPKEEMLTISEFTEFPLGTLPVRYLGVPLITGKLTRQDCKVLVDKITQKLRSWRSKLLSYAGKIQLISTVITSTLQYWLNIFLLPQFVIKEVGRLCNEFLWDSAEDGSRKKGVMAWDKLSIPKKEGGLGIRNFGVWNKACVLRHLWEILTLGGSIWVAWISRYRLKGRSIWELSVGSAGTLIWKRLLKCKAIAYPFVSGNGSNTLWQGEQMKQFSMSRVWNDIREKKPEVQWWRLVWAKEIIPKHGLILWLAIHGRLVTQDKLLAWGENVSGCCVLCPGGVESRDHLMIYCSYSLSVLKLCMKSLSPPDVGDWEATVAWCAREWKKKAARSRLCRVLWCTAVSYIWRERCSRMYRTKVIRDPAMLVKLIREEVTYRVYEDPALQLELDSIQ